MSAEDQSKLRSGDAQRSQADAHGSQTSPGEQHYAHSAQAQRDEEIEAIQQHSRHQHPEIQRPPELPPAPPRKALMMVGVLLPVSICPSMARLTPESLARRSSECPRWVRNRLRFLPRIAGSSVETSPGSSAPGEPAKRRALSLIGRPLRRCHVRHAPNRYPGDHWDHDRESREHESSLGRVIRAPGE